MSYPRRNIETQYRCADLAAVQRRADALGAEDGGILLQRDLFFQSGPAR